MHSNLSLKQNYVALCHYIHKEFKLNILYRVGLLFVQYYSCFVSWFHQYNGDDDNDDDDGDDDEDDDNNNNDDNIIIKFAFVKVQMSLFTS